jgi:hypothetical protein
MRHRPAAGLLATPREHGVNGRMARAVRELSMPAGPKEGVKMAHIQVTLVKGRRVQQGRRRPGE